MVRGYRPGYLGHPAGLVTIEFRKSRTFQTIGSPVEHTTVILWAGFAIGLLFGVIAQRMEFCLSGGLREWWGEGRPRRAAGFLLAMGTAVTATQAAALGGGFAPRDSIYLQPTFSWSAVPAGGVLFGYGMVAARGCGSRALVLLADGNLRSLLVLLCLGVSAFAALTGILAPARLWLSEFGAVSPQWATPGLDGALLSAGWAEAPARLVPGLAIGFGLAAFALGPLGLRKAPGQVLGGVLIGLLVPAGWIVTGHFGADDFDPVPVESLTFVAPIGDSIQYLMLATGISMQFGVAVVGGVLAGALAASLAARDFELRGFENPREMLRAIYGGMFMGIGGALAIGCSVGQGLSGLSTLAVASLLAVAGIFAGAFLAVRGPVRLRDTA